MGGMRPQVDTPEHLVARIASRQHGVISFEQLLDAGLSRDVVKRRVRKGLLHREFRGVYRVGHTAPSTEAHYYAAVLACGAGAALSSFAAAYLTRILTGPPPPPEVTSLAAKRHPGIAHHRAMLDHRDTTIYRAIPTTTIPRTIVDLAAKLPLESLALLCHNADVKHHVRPAAVAAAVRRRGWTPGVRNLREIYEGGHRLTLSRLETLFLDALRHHDLPLPHTNRRKGAHYVDCRWPQHRLTVELDSYRFHHTRHAWEQDRQRERAARARGDEFRRYTWADVTEDSALMLAELRVLLFPTRRYPSAATAR
jgi:hypothetical protein